MSEDLARIRDPRILSAAFERDETTRARNLRERGFAFATALFDNPVVEKEDLRRDYGEPRITGIGMIEERYFVVVYTLRGDKRRIISARQASRRERSEYRSANPG